MLRKIIFITLLILTNVPLFSQSNILNSGPMVGHSQMREATLWVQTLKEANAQIRYWNKNNPEIVYKTKVVKTNPEKSFTVHLIADEVEPGNIYGYDLLLNGVKVELPYKLEFETQDLWQYRHDPPSFSFAAGSCAHINEKPYDRPQPYGANYEIFEAIVQKAPNFMLWTGDYLYFREADYYSRTGMIKRYTYHRAIPELQPLFGSIHHYAIWDDHDYGPNNSDRSFVMKETSLELFKQFWANPSYGIYGKPGITTFFKWADVDFFLLDNRYYRSPEHRKSDRVMHGNEQIEWLIDALCFSKAPFKIIVTGGQVLSSVAEYENYATYPEEREQLLTKILEENISGVLFIDGDRHFTELSKLERMGTYPLYDFTISPLTSGPFNREKENNIHRVEGTYYNKRNFGIFDIDGPRKNRTLKCTIYDTSGREIWDYAINENELR